ncbi:MAG: glucosaminidase domain-containing protein [Spirochaetaceae bacterium]|jgi:hypothetical protein|nr:glucosaminidase domain-containing protein [Spirochaetaceae bacterium]
MQRAFVSNLIITVFAVSACALNHKSLYADEVSPLNPEDELALARTAPWLWEPPSSSHTRIPPSPEKILGKGKIKSEELAWFLVKTNPFIQKDFAEDFAKIYVEEAALEGVNHDVAFSQMCLETGFLSFGGLVNADMNNFCGLGSTGPETRGESFPSARIGVRAQIQHLKAYATDEPLNQENVDPRRHYVRAGSASTIYQLAGSWAEDKEYGKKIKMILDRLYAAIYTVK